MQLRIIESDADVAAHLASAFGDCPEVAVSLGNILSVAEVCVVSPANGYGYMDGGVDRDYRQYFGEQLESSVRHLAAARPEGYLPVGASAVVRTGHTRIPYMIVAPTMVMPEAVPAAHAGRAMRAVLRAAEQNKDVITKVYCPGLGTGGGSISAKEASDAMAIAYREWKTGLTRR